MFKEKVYKVCPECESILEEITESNQLPYVTYEMYKDKEYFNKENVLYCVKCKILFVEDPLYNYSHDKIKNMLKTIWNKVWKLLTTPISL